MNQGNLGSCGSHALVAAVEFLHRKENRPPVVLSPLFVYYEARQRAGVDVRQNVGVPADRSYMAVEQLGVCLEDLWPYDEAMFATPPTADAYADADVRQNLKSKKHVTLREIKSSIAEGFPVLIQFGVCKSFDDPVTRSTIFTTGVFPVPSEADPSTGGHAVLVVGYDDEAQHVEFQNSWGAGFGDQGFGKLHYGHFGEHQDTYIPTSTCSAGDAASVRGIG